ncbi:MAG: hypothetical protein QF375_06280, partial [Arenicellales bacterium]|nr:hypothetical protein [Arenicellales bacterium]
RGYGRSSDLGDVNRAKHGQAEKKKRKEKGFWTIVRLLGLGEAATSHSVDNARRILRGLYPPPNY